MEDPGARLAELGIGFSDAIDGTGTARLDAGHRVIVNYETYLFRDQETRSRFLEDPVRHAGIVTDPVTKQRFRPGRSTPRLDRDGRIWLFLDDRSRAAFVAKPGAYRAPGLPMIGMPERDAPVTS